MQGEGDVTLVDIVPTRDEAKNSEIDDGYYQLIVFGPKPLNRQPTDSPSHEMARGQDAASAATDAASAAFNHDDWR